MILLNPVTFNYRPRTWSTPWRNDIWTGVPKSRRRVQIGLGVSFWSDRPEVGLVGLIPSCWSCVAEVMCRRWLANQRWLVCLPTMVGLPTGVGKVRWLQALYKVFVVSVEIKSVHLLKVIHKWVQQHPSPKSLNRTDQSSTGLHIDDVGQESDRDHSLSRFHWGI